MKKHFRHASLLALALMLLSASGSRGQSIVTGGVAGTVTDPTGAVVSGADVLLKSAATGEQFKTTTSSGGDYVFSLLKPGDYTLSIEKPGFKTATRPITVLLGTTVSGNTALEVGSGTTTIEVSAENLAQLQNRERQHLHELRHAANSEYSESRRRRNLRGADRPGRRHECLYGRRLRQLQHLWPTRHFESFYPEWQRLQ